MRAITPRSSTVRRATTLRWSSRPVGEHEAEAFTPFCPDSRCYPAREDITDLTCPNWCSIPATPPASSNKEGPRARRPSSVLLEGNECI